MEDKRIEFINKRERQKFFKDLAIKLQCRNYKQLAKKLKINDDSLKQWRSGTRSIPFSLIQDWVNWTGINLNEYEIKTFSIKQILKNASKKGIQKLKNKYGKNWMKKLGKQGRESLQKLLKNPLIYKKWRESIKKSLIAKFGPEYYKIIGQKGGRKSIKSISPNKLKRQLKKAFRKSFKFRLKYRRLKLRSHLELKVAKFLVKKKIPFKYEDEINGYFPDFLIKSKLIIETVGFEWKVRIEKVRLKLKKFIRWDYEVIVFTYPNMVKYFNDLPVTVVTNLKELDDFLAYNRAKVSSSGSW